MHKYIENTQFAAQSLVNLIVQSEEDMQKLDNHIKKIEFLRVRFMDNQFSMRVMHDYNQLMKEIEKTEQFEKEHEQYITEYVSKYTALATVAGALLQIGAQGISVAYGDVGSCGKHVRKIESQEIQEIIWAARIQSMHYEEGKYDRRTTDCFHQMISDFVDEKFAIGKGRNKDRNLALDVVKILEWNTYEQYEKDMIGLLG